MAQATLVVMNKQWYRDFFSDALTLGCPMYSMNPFRHLGTI
jgi:hypothetical protein